MFGTFGEFFRKYKTVILAIGIFVVLSLVYVLFFRGSIVGDATLLQSSVVRTEDEALRDELLGLIEALKRVNLDERLFEDERFKALTDFSVELLPQPAGRSNPFLPLSGGGGFSEDPALGDSF